MDFSLSGLSFDGLKLVGRGKLYLGKNWDECHLLTEECVFYCEEVFFFPLDKT